MTLTTTRARLDAAVASSNVMVETFSLGVRQTFVKLRNIYVTRKHSSRMHTVRCSDRRGLGLGVCFPEVCFLGEMCFPGVWQGGVLARGCTCLRGVPALGGVPGQGVDLPGGVYSNMH